MTIPALHFVLQIVLIGSHMPQLLANLANYRSNSALAILNYAMLEIGTHNS